jgi:hypothetical protein
MLNPYEIFTKWSESLASVSAAAGQQQREVADGWIKLLVDMAHPVACLARVKKINKDVAGTMEESITDWLRVAATQQQCLGDRIRNGVEFFEAKSVSEAQAKMVALSELSHATLRISVQALARAGARLMQPWAAFGLPSILEPNEDLHSNL